MKKNNGWIAIEDEKPEEGQWALVIQTPLKKSKEYDYETDKWENGKWKYAYKDAVIMYWQPLPELPKELR